MKKKHHFSIVFQNEIVQSNENNEKQHETIKREYEEHVQVKIEERCIPILSARFSVEFNRNSQYESFDH